VDEVPLPFGPGQPQPAGKHFVGPDPEAALARTGAAAIVCLNELGELEDRYPEYVQWLVANQPGRAVWRPIHDMHAPAPEVATHLLAELHARLEAGDGLLVHCGAGIGRAGTMAAALLVTGGVALDEALRVVRASRPMAGPEVGAQLDLLRHLAGQSS
jgi:protein-tyrosine phosphatase